MYKLITEAGGTVPVLKSCTQRGGLAVLEATSDIAHGTRTGRDGHGGHGGHGWKLLEIKIL